MTKELACGPLDVFFRGAAHKGIAAEELARGVGYSLQHLRRKRERIDWSAALTFFANAEQLFTEEELEDLGVSFLTSPVLKKFAAIPRLLFTTAETYRWLSTGSAGQGMTTCITPEAREPSPGHFVLRLRMHPGYSPARAYFLVSKGIMRSIPTYLGYEQAEVDMQEHVDGVTYDIRFPIGGGALAWLRRAVTWPFAAFRVAKELDVANREIFEREHELALADEQITFQGRQLHTAYEISRLVNEDIDPQTTAELIARNMVEWGGLDAVSVKIDAVLFDREVMWRSAEGQVENNTAKPRVFPLRNRGERIGELKVWGAEEDPRRALVKLLLPTVEMAVAHAVQFDEGARRRSDLERQVALRNRELKSLRETHRKNLAELEETFESRERFFADINHEIRNPLSLSLLCLDQLSELAPKGSDAAHRLSTVRDAHHQVLDLVDRLLKVAEHQHAEPLETRRLVAVDALLARLVRAWEPAAEHAGVALHLDVPPRLNVRGDEKELGRVFANLLSNALKFTPAGGRVDVVAREQEGAWRIEVRDSGVGIADAEKATVFGRFQQGPAAVRPGARGSGIGLSIVRQLLAAHEGTISVEDNVPAGTRFCVTLPRAEATEEEPEITAPGNRVVVSQLSGERLDASASDGPRPRVLVAEDNDAMRAHLVELLSPRYEVVAAANGHDALLLAAQHQPDLLLSDVEMPLMNGLELARRFRKLEGNRLRPVILLTARLDPRTVRRGFESGAVDYVRKPVEGFELLGRIEAQLALRTLATRLADRERLGSLGLLVSSLAHEVRNPVNGVVNALGPLRELLPEVFSDPELPASQLLDVAETCAEQLRSLSEQLLGFARDDGLVLRRTDLATVLNRAIAVMGGRAGTRINLMLPRQIDVMASPSLLVQVFVNLFDNARQAHDEAEIEVRAELDDEHVVIEVSDNGPGIAPEHRRHIFDPFFTTKGDGGTGLGLHTVRQIVEQHAGTIDLIDLGSGPGTHFRIRLPRPQSGQARTAELRA